MRALPGHGAVRQRVPRGRRRARCCSPAAGPASAPPLWQQRQRSGRPAGRGREASDVPDAARDHARMPARRVRRAGAPRGHGATSARARTKLVAVDTERASPFAQSLLFRWVAIYMYEGDAPLAERRAAALALDRDLLRELLGERGAPRPARPGARSTSSSSSCSGSPRAGGRANADDVHDLLRERRRPDRRRDRGADRAATRPRGSSGCSREGRAIRVRVAGEARLAAVEDAARAARRARRLAPDRPAGGVHRADGASARDARRPVRPHARAVPRQPRSAARLGAGVDRVRAALDALEASGRVDARRVPPAAAARRRTRMVRRRRAAPAPSAFARRAPQRGRAGRRRDARAVPPRVAGRRAAVDRSRRADGRDRSPAGRGRPGVDPGDTTSCPRASAGSAPWTWTRCARAATWCGSGPGRSAPTTAASRSTSATRCGSSRRLRRTSRRRVRSTFRSASTSRGTAHRSGPTSSRRPGPATNAWCSPRSGTWSGPARSRTTRWRRSAR